MSRARLKTQVWIQDYITSYDVYSHGVKAILATRETAFQHMMVVDAGVFGKALVLDWDWQTSALDEFLYHEPLVQPACLQQGGPEQVLVLGGGDGGALREVLRWNTVQRAVMVDIDGEVVEACREHLEDIHQGAFDDPRTELVVADAWEYLDGVEGRYDVIVTDLTDPLEEGPAFKLFTREFFEKCRRALRSGGCFAMQAGTVSLPLLGLHARVANTVAAVFGHALNYFSSVPSYAIPWGFVLAADSPIDTRPDPDAVDRLLREKTAGGLRMLDGRALLGLLNPPRHLRDALAAEETVYSQAAPPSYHQDMGSEPS